MKIRRIFLNFISTFSFILLLVQYTDAACGPGETETFERVTGQVPQTTAETLLLTREPGLEPLSAECAQSCRNSTNGTCDNFVVDYNQNACFAVNVAETEEVFGFNSTDFFQAPNVAFYNKICIKAPSGCDKLTWMLERAPGFELRTNRVILLSDIKDRLKCAEKCFTEKRFSCRSAQYEPETKKCRLSSEDRRTAPHAFVPSVGSTEYLENQCNQFQHLSSQVCSYEEFRESTVNLTDVSISGVKYHKCRQLCDAERRFRCRGFTFIVSSDKAVIAQTSQCLLHSADIASAGPNALVALPGALYSERAPCIDLLLRCSKNQTTLKLRTPDPFYGRIFVRGYSNVCDVTGKGTNETVLKIGPKCATFTDTSVNVAVIVQYNAILQRRGDRALNVTCMYGDSLLAAVNGSITVDGDPFLGGALSVNSSDAATAAVRIIITDRQGLEASITEVGRDLELRVLAVNTDPFDIAAGQLIASNVEGTESVLLLDERGCPPDPATFPALQKVPGSRDLIARFRAFRFTTSTVVRFHVRVHFCLQTCPPVDCGPAGDSFGRKRRDDAAVTAEGGNTLGWSLEPANHETMKETLDTAGLPSEMPLEMDIYVLSDPHSIIKVQSNESGTFVRDDFTVFDIPTEETIDEYPSSWCVSEAVFIGVLISWILLQIIFGIAIWTAARTLANRPTPAPGSVKLRNVTWQGNADAFN